MTPFSVAVRDVVSEKKFFWKKKKNHSHILSIAVDPELLNQAGHLPHFAPGSIMFLD